MEFNVGDKVKIQSSFYREHLGLVCHVIKSSHDNSMVFVEFNQRVFQGHTCKGLCKNGYGRHFFKRNLILIKPVVIDEYEEWED